MKVAFRTDASLQIGTGHVMRSLTLADALHRREVDCLFLCRPHKGHLMDQITARGHRVIALSTPSTQGSHSTDNPVYDTWLGTSWERDTQEMHQAFAGEKVDWLVVDHYALDHRWERALRPNCKRLMVMDDLANRKHDCDLLLDPSLGRSQSDYAGLAPTGATMLLGPRYALLRPEFRALRDRSLTRRNQPQLQHLLITMGGVDKGNTTERVLKALNAASLPYDDLQITVVMGPHAPWLNEVRARAARMRMETQVLVSVSDIASLMTDSDLAIGAAGSTSWERLCLGLPTIQFILAENQVECARQFAQVGAVIGISAAQNFGPELICVLKELDTEGLHSMSVRAAQVCDGLGVDRVLRVMFGHE